MSKWKKIGSVHSGQDIKSNRSMRSRTKDDMPTHSFRENIARMKINSNQFIDSQNTYFCQNLINRNKQTNSNRSLSRIKTEKSLTHFGGDAMRSMISKKRLSKDDDNQSHCSGITKNQKEQPKKLKQFAKQSQIKALKEDHLKLKEYVKFQINSFKAAFKDLSAQLKFQINYRKEAIAQKSKSESKPSKLTPIVPYRFDSKILDNMNFQSVNKKGTSKGQQADINVLSQIKTEIRLCIDSLNEFQNQKAQILQRYKDINLQELLA